MTNCDDEDDNLDEYDDDRRAPSDRRSCRVGDERETEIEDAFGDGGDYYFSESA